MDGLFIGKDHKYIDKVKGNSTLSLLARGNDVEIILLEVLPDRPCSVAPGENPDLLEFYFVLEGSILIELDGSSVKLDKDDYFYVNNIKEILPIKTIGEAKLLYISSQPVFQHLYSYNEDLNKLLIKSEAKDMYTHKHSNRVQDYAMKISNKMQLSSEINYTLALASLFHDIGKCFVPDEILNKPGMLTKDEFKYIERHSTDSRILLDGKFVEKVGAIVEQHHERLDGTGYPKGLKEDEIFLESKIIAVADSYDAMTSDRSYKKAMSPETTIEELKSLAGKFYDEKVINALEKVLKDEGVI